MRIDRDQIRAHAQERLEGLPAGSGPRERLEPFRRFLKLETERLRMRHRFGLGGLEIASARSYQVDQIVTGVCRFVAGEMEPAGRRELETCAVVALGGYGRGELAPFSDVDLLFLHLGRAGDAVRRFAEQVLLMLWDIGLSVGHSFRSPGECVAIARHDLHSRTALAEARLVTGRAEALAGLLASLEAGLRGQRRATEQFLASIRTEQAERHARLGGAVGVQEPNVKEGVGGLRDLHTVLWVAQARFGSRGLEGLHAEGRISDRDYRAVRRCYDFLARVRNEAHFATGRRSDLLTLDLQPDLAQGLGYEQKDGLLASEIFMRDYFRRASELHAFAAAFLRRHLEDSPLRVLPSLGRARPEPGFEVRAGRLHARGVELRGGGLAMLSAFAAAQAEGAPLSDELERAIRDRVHFVTPAFRRSREAGAIFLDVLRWRGRVGPVLRAMHETGFLGRFLPELGRVTFLVQHDLFHRYTVDEHTLRGVEALDEVAEGDDPVLRGFGRVFDEVEDAAPLYLGMLLHDIGKGRGGGHIPRGAQLAPRVCARLGLEEHRTQDVVFLVASHQEMSRVSQRRDLSEAALIASFAERVGGLGRLNMLLLLTYADHRAVGPGVWSEWKGALLWELYRRSREHLAGQAGDPNRRREARAEAVESLRAEYPPADIERHFALMPERYLRTTDAVRMARHFRLVKARKDAPAAFDWHDLAGGQGTELTLVTDDRRGLLADVAGTLTAQGIDILAVDVFSRGDGVVIDTFRLSEVAFHRPVSPERRVRVEEQLKGALAGRHDVEAAVARWLEKNPRRPRPALGRAARGPAVRFDQEASAAATVVEVKAQDRPGLAWTIARTLAHFGLDITFAKIATAKALALDVFYVTDAGGRKLAPETLPAVEQALLATLGGRAQTRTRKEAE
jgi:[protein-PII] uridylyltransferase